MNYLLDTHAFLFAVYGSPDLHADIRLIITEPANTIFISAVSFWEIAIKCALGKFRIGDLSPEEMPGIGEQMGFTTISLTPQEASTCHRLPRNKHKDPFDRMLVWQAISRGTPLISRDHRLSCYEPSGLKLIW